LDVKHGGEPVLFVGVDKDTEVTFWYKPGIMSALGLCRIVLVAMDHPNNENNAKIIWPQNKIVLNYGKELQAIFGGNDHDY